jgi:hypothetical protein
LADAFRGVLAIQPGFLRTILENASAKADPTENPEPIREHGTAPNGKISLNDKTHASFLVDVRCRFFNIVAI